MKPFYSILYASIRPIAKEQLSIGLLFSNNENVLFKYSIEKMSHLRGLMDSSAYSLMKTYLRNVEDYLNESTSQSGFEIDFGSRKTEIIEKKYISYLSNYSNNLITFSKPAPIDLELTPNNFRALFEKFVFEYEEPIVVKEPFEKRIKKRLYPRIRSNVNTDIQITQKLLPSLLFPTEVNFLGKNEVPTAGKIIDFEKGHYYVESDISKFISLIKAFEVDKEGDGKYYIIGKEPLKKSVQHGIWDQIRKSSFIDFVPTSEIDLIVDYIDEHHVSPFFETSDEE